MAALGSQSIASSYEQLLHVDRDGGGNTTNHVSVKDGDNGTTFALTLATDAVMITSDNRLEFGDDGTYIHQSANGVLDLVSDTELELNATTIDMNGAVDISGDTTTAGNLIIDADNKGLVLGDGQDATIYSDSSGQVVFVMGSGTGVGTNEGSIQFNITDSSDTTQNLYGGEGASAILRLTADQGDDDDDSYRLVANASGNFLIESASTGSWVTQLKLDGSATDVTVSAGDLLFATAGKGICLGVTSNTDANTLDDYEEGDSHTVTITCGSSGTITLNGSNNTLSYVKIGTLCAVQGRLVVSSVSSPVGWFKFALPFVIASLTEDSDRTCGSIFMNGNTTANTSDFQLTTGATGSTDCYVYLGDATTPQSDSSEQMQANTQFDINITYRTA